MQFEQYTTEIVNQKKIISEYESKAAINGGITTDAA